MKEGYRPSAQRRRRKEKKRGRWEEGGWRTTRISRLRRLILGFLSPARWTEVALAQRAVPVALEGCVYQTGRSVSDVSGLT